jgi:hypothetical protein
MKTICFKQLPKLLVASLLLASLSQVKAADVSPTPSSTPTTPTPAPSAASLIMKGKVKALDTTNKTFTLKAKKVSNIFTITDSTTFLVGKKSGQLSDLQVGGTVKVTYSTGTDGKLTATSVVISKKKNNS